jgi:molybdenum cofactor biosynthesis enzyme MoaA
MNEPPLPGWRPKLLWWLVTGRCSLACEHCFLRGTSQRGRQLTREHALDIVQRAAAMGIQEVVLTGGEPLLRQDLPELLTAFSAHGLRLVGLETHGSPLDACALDAAPCRAAFTTWLDHCLDLMLRGQLST